MSPVQLHTEVMMRDEKNKKSDAPRGDRPADDEARRESGQPGGGAGRRDEVGPTGVYPMSGGIPPGKHPEIRTPAAWGQGERGAEGYNDSGGSELVLRDGQLLGGLTSGPSGEPTIDIHGGDVPEQAKRARDGEPPRNSEQEPSGDPRHDR
jgi:hypothetical protein